MSNYPDYVHQTLARARDIGQWYCGQADAAALCFDMLALFPDCTKASDLVYELFCDEGTIYDNRVAVQRHISAALPDQAARPPADLVDWSFLDEDDGQPGEPAGWVMKMASLIYWIMTIEG